MAQRQRLDSLVWFMRISAASASGLIAAAYWPVAGLVICDAHGVA